MNTWNDVRVAGTIRPLFIEYLRSIIAEGKMDDNKYWEIERRLSQKFDEAAHAISSFRGAAIEPETRYHLTQALGQMMSEISEGRWAAGWFIDLEDTLPFELMERKAIALPYDGGEMLDDQVAAGMCAIADLLGHWADYRWYPEGGEHYVPYRPIKKPA